MRYPPALYLDGPEVNSSWLSFTTRERNSFPLDLKLKILKINFQTGGTTGWIKEAGLPDKADILDLEDISCVCVQIV